MFKRKNIIFVLAGAVIGAALVGFLFLSFVQNAAPPKKQGNNFPTPTVRSTPEPTDKSQALPERGVIEGSLSFPSEGIPTDMKICAEEAVTKVTTCTQTHIKDAKYTFRVGYRLVVPAGKYYVYSQVPSIDDYKAYYNEFVTCGLSANCTSHKLIEVEVKANETTSGVDPQDWYNRPTPTP